MALTKISRSLLDTGISDSSDATAITIDSSENVTIGVTNPVQISTNLMHGTSGQNGFYVRTAISSAANPTFSNIDDTNTGAFFPAADTVGFTTGGSERMRIDSSGNVLVGTTTFNNLSTEAGVLASNNVVMARGSLADHQDACAVLQYSSDTTWLRAYGDTAGSGLMVFRVGGGAGSTDTEAMRIDSSGNVGIGTSSPNAYTNYTVLTIDSPSSGTGSVIDLEYRTDRSLSMFSEGSLSTIREIRNYPLALGTNDTEAMRIDSSGQVFVGRTSSVDAGLFIVSANPSTYNHITTIPEANASYNALTMTDYVGNRLGAISVGTSGSTAITYGNSSDYRLKENIVPMEKGLERVNKLKPVKFDWKSDGTTSEGFIAHEIQEAGWVLGVTGKKDDEEMQMVDYGKLTPLLVKAIQEQQEQIEALQSEINTLKGG